MSALPEWVALSLIDQLGGKRLRALLDHFGDVSSILEAEEQELRAVRGIGGQIASAIRRVDQQRTAADLQRWSAAGVRALTWDDPAYPRRLTAIPDPPPTLFISGPADFTLLNRRRWIAVVGTRQPRPAALEAAHTLAYHLAQRDAVIVSGLALGIDAGAHMGVLAAMNGLTIAVLGCGVLNVYPPENRGLAGAIAGRGALISEQPPDAGAKAAGLVARNRIISGLCDALVVVETGIDGGAMHAARRALEQRRTVYTFDFDASGNQALIRDGAKVLSPDYDELFTL